ncbi:hypothetical protein D2U88_00440 [Flagellimonas aequoris]|uniref:Uncharacterized protein n=1 Tax=Flagellimonas aequoris TaxID=2306997 RepID=A0A418NBX3_9FLAO|nr:hypothetical protein D2U88_00440 [Allomuricauda aequoris]
MLLGFGCKLKFAMANGIIFLCCPIRLKKYDLLHPSYIMSQKYWHKRIFLLTYINKAYSTDHYLMLEKLATDERLVKRITT